VGTLKDSIDKLGVEHESVKLVNADGIAVSVAAALLAVEEKFPQMQKALCGRESNPGGAVVCQVVYVCVWRRWVSDVQVGPRGGQISMRGWPRLFVAWRSGGRGCPDRVLVWSIAGSCGEGRLQEDA
jgi:hypothetical protein